MQIEVYKQTKPPLRRRPVVVSSLFLLVSCALAAQMTFSRAADPLGRTLRLVELNCSLRPPRGFVPQNTLVSPDWRIQPFEATLPPWGRAELAVWYTLLEDAGGTKDVADTILRQLRGGTEAAQTAATLSQNDNTLLGTNRAYEVGDPSVGVIVRVARLPTRGYLAISIAAEPPVGRWINTFDAVCRSVEVAP